LGTRLPSELDAVLGEVADQVVEGGQVEDGLRTVRRTIGGEVNDDRGGIANQLRMRTVATSRGRPRLCRF
jgi:hypothetical protein